MKPREHAPDMLVADIGLGFEPIVCLSSALTHGARAVPRYRDAGPTAASATPAATEDRVTATVLGLVAATMASAGPPAYVVVDLPARAWNGTLVEMTERTLGRHGVAATAVGFTLSADDAVHDAPTAAAVVVELQDLGCRVGLAGVGGGFGSIRLLSVLPVDFARIDPTLVANMLEHPDALSQVTGVLRLAAEAGVTTTAVGVDTYEHSAWLRDLGCGFGTGAFFGHASDWLVLPTSHECGP